MIMSKSKVILYVVFCLSAIGAALYLVISALYYPEDKIKPHIILILGDDIVS